MLSTKRRPAKGHGGWRPGAGRKKSQASSLPHMRRAPLSWRHPVHVTWRIVKGLPSLRSRRAFRVIRDAFIAAVQRFGLTLCEYSVQSNHIHLVVEPAHRPALSKGLQALGVRLARRLNRVFGRRVIDVNYFCRLTTTRLAGERQGERVASASG